MLRRSSRSCWGGWGINFGRLDGETPHESLLPNCFLHCREYRSWLTGLVIRSWWRWKRSGLKIGFAPCELGTCTTIALWVTGQVAETCGGIRPRIAGGIRRATDE